MWSGIGNHFALVIVLRLLLAAAPKNVAYRNETIHFVCACEIEISASMWVGLNAGMGNEEICVQLLPSLVGWFVASHTLPAATGWQGSKLQALLPLMHLVSFLM